MAVEKSHTPSPEDEPQWYVVHAYSGQDRKSVV